MSEKPSWKQNDGPVISIDLDWGSEDPVPFVEGVLIVKIATEAETGNGWPSYRVTAPLVRLVGWVAEHYLMFDEATTANLEGAFLAAQFAKVTTAFNE